MIILQCVSPTLDWCDFAVFRCMLGEAPMILNSLSDAQMDYSGMVVVVGGPGRVTPQL